MLSLFKRIAIFSITVFLTSIVNAQDGDTIVYSETDSLQDVRIEQLHQQIGSVKSLLGNNIQGLELKTDSLLTVNESQADQILKLSEESELLRKKLASAYEEIGENMHRLKDGKKTFKTVYFITVPVLLLVALTVFAILFVLLTRHRNSTNTKIKALRKYTHEGIEEVRADYVKEIKRRVKKITSKLKRSNKRKGSKTKSETTKKKSDSEKGTKSSSSNNTKSKKKEA